MIVPAATAHVGEEDFLNPALAKQVDLSGPHRRTSKVGPPDAGGQARTDDGEADLRRVGNESRQRVDEVQDGPAAHACRRSGSEQGRGGSCACCALGSNDVSQRRFPRLMPS